jgi:hypothetical protein
MPIKVFIIITKPKRESNNLPVKSIKMNAIANIKLKGVNIFVTIIDNKLRDDFVFI